MVNSRSLIAIFSILLWALGLPAALNADTHVSGNLASNATWTTAGSPYIVDGGLFINSGATLTIRPGVVVKMNGQGSNIAVGGTLSAVGTPTERIVFTSIQDDSIAGDSGGDGPTVGQPGQWYGIGI